MDVLAASQRIGRLVWETPVVPWHRVLTASHTPFLKLENTQRSGSFKLRGATNYLMRLGPQERSLGVVTCSSGNHGRAVATAGKALGIPVRVFVPEWVDPVKLAGMRAAGAEVHLEGSSFDESEALSFAYADAHGTPYLSAFDDLAVIEGQGTLGVEILTQVPDVSEVLLPLSGGGLAAGVAWALKDTGVRVIAVSAERARVMMASVEAGAPVSLPEETTVASALAGGIGPQNQHSFHLVQELVDEYLVVSEESIRHAMRYAYADLKLVVEGGGAVALAAMLDGYTPTGRAVVVLSGGNIGPDLLHEVMG